MVRFPYARSSTFVSRPKKPELKLTVAGQPDKQLSQIEKSVTHLLVATKQLLETLTRWSCQEASETDVSDVYVQLGYQFNLACRAFNSIGVETSDLGPVPDLLRTILEDTLSQEASRESLDRYLPKIRDIIINLLHGLKRKQARLRARQTREEGKANGRQASMGSVGSFEAGPANASDETSPQSPHKRSFSSRRYGSGGSLEDQSSYSRDRTGNSYSEREASRREAQKALMGAQSTPATSTSASQHQFTPSPYSDFASYHTPPPPPPPKQDDAIGALQRSGELERRASRRFSAYQIQKALGTSANGVPLPSQPSSASNRGRDVRESLNAVRLRGSYVHGRQRSTAVQGPEHPSSGEPGDRSGAKPRVEASTEAREGGGSPRAKTPTDKLRSDHDLAGKDGSSGGLAEGFDPGKSTGPDGRSDAGTPQPHHKDPSASFSTPPHSQHFIPDQSPSPGKELTLFLQYKSKIKKYVIPEGSTGLTLGRLQLAFIEKFAWNTHQHGDLPEIYIQDPISGVRHELEDLSDVKDRSVLVLNVEALDEVKRHFDDGLNSIRHLIDGLKTAVDGQETIMQRMSERQLETAKEMARLAAAPSTSLSPNGRASPAVGRQNGRAGGEDQLQEIQSLRRDLAVLRQTYSSFTSDIAASMNKIRAKAASVKSAAESVATAPYEGDAGRARINAGKKELSDESEKLVARVDDLQDLVEDLRKDVVSRGVRPHPHRLEAVSKDITAVTKDVKKMKEFLKREKPIWTKIWEKELQLVCEERDQLTMQEDLAADLEDDLEKAAQTFALVEQATRQQNMQGANRGPAFRSASRNLPVDPTVDPLKAKDSVLGEVRALQVNHESRLEAIERAEKARQKELEARRIDVFQKELGQFVEEGKLKKSGGIEETERLRRAKDERNRKEAWQAQHGQIAEPPAKEDAAAKGSSAQPAAETTTEATTEPKKEDTASPPSKDENSTEANANDEKEENAPESASR